MGKTLRYALVLGLLLGNISVARAEIDPENYSQPIQDAKDSLALMAPARALVQMTQARIAGDDEAVVTLHKANYGGVEKLLKKNPKSPMGLYLRGQYKNIAKKNSGTRDFKQLVSVTTRRIAEDPTYVQNYELRADANKELGKNREARADYSMAMLYARDSTKIEQIKRDIARLDAMEE